jgi:hypothetical protein
MSTALQGLKPGCDAMAYAVLAADHAATGHVAAQL